MIDIADQLKAIHREVRAGGVRRRDQHRGTAPDPGRRAHGGGAEDPVAAANSPEAQRFNLGSIALWTTAVEVSGTAAEDELAAAVEVSEAQFAPDVD